MKNALFFFLLIALPLRSGAQLDAGRPGIGLTLSGGGAKGLAHIGILKAIDSAGLKIDYITGTSMGSIVGGLYALGYSADSIEKMARALDWDELLTNQISLRALIMEEKGEYGKYAIELPLLSDGFRLPTGVLESQEMWLKLQEFFAPAYNIRDFDKMPIPFRCIGTEVGTGNALVLRNGNLVTAIRASMAIPTVFTAVEVDGCALVDGGIVRNFPVSDVRDMGAGFVIGSSVSSGLLPQEKLTDAAQILMQVIFLEDGLQHSEQAELCDIYIENDLEDYTAGSFNRSDEIIDLGLAEGRRWYPVFQRLADSLDARYGKPFSLGRKMPRVDSVFISSYEIRGLRRTKESYFTKMMGFETGRYYNVARLASRVRNVFGTRYYQRVLYTLEPQDDGSARIIFDVVENAPTQAKLGLHYNTFSSISLITNLTTRNLFMPASRSLVSLALSENFRARGEHLQQFGARNQLALIGSLQFETFGFTTFRKFTVEGLKRQNFFKSEVRVQLSANRRFAIGTGWRYEWIKYKPSITAPLDVRGNFTLHNAIGYLSYNTLDDAVLPRKGLKMDMETGYVFGQSPRLLYYSAGEPILNPDSLGYRFDAYPRATLDIQWYAPLSEKVVFLLHHQTGLNFDYRQGVLNAFAVGGLVSQFRNQITFAGLQEATIYTPSVAALQLGVRYNVAGSLYLVASTNSLIHNFVSRQEGLPTGDFLTGHALSLNYSTPVGPIEVSAMYSDQSKKVGTYVNLGLKF
ncbi:MAG: patatin-like phospholipase family protein [Lewinellaceae bacterium]|nr:patatin-like phospholipase family protein [Lewinellaceae bacterium]